VTQPNGLRNNIIIWVCGVFLSAMVGYAGGQIGIAKELGKRPDRQEVSRAVTDLREGIQRELDDVKDRQDRTQRGVDSIQRTLQEILLEQRNGRRRRSNHESTVDRPIQ